MDFKLCRLLLSVIMVLAVGLPSAADDQAGNFMDQFSGRIFIVGDSTASAYGPGRAPRMGWGQVLEPLYNDYISVFNLAKSGRSTRSYIDEGYFAALETHLDKGDFLLVQFGHNDQKTDRPKRYAPAGTLYKELLKRYVGLAKEKGAKPVLLTSVVRRHYEGGELVPTLSAYTAAMMEVAEEASVDLIDMNSMTRSMVLAAGEEGSKTLYLHLKKGASPLSAHADVVDNTHFSAKGAYVVAAMVADALDQLGLKLFRRQ